MARKEAKKSPETLCGTGRNIYVRRAHEFDDGVVSFDMDLWDQDKKNAVSIFGCTLRKNKKGEDFVAFPNRKGSDGVYYNYALTKITDEELEVICKQIDELV